MISAQIFSLFWLKKPLKLNSGKPALSTETKVLKIWLPLMISSASKLCPKRKIFGLTSSPTKVDILWIWLYLHFVVLSTKHRWILTLFTFQSWWRHATLKYKHIETVLLSLSAPLLAVHSKPSRRPSRLVSGRKPSTSWIYRRIHPQWNTTWRSLSTTPPCRTSRWERRDEDGRN